MRQLLHPLSIAYTLSLPSHFPETLPFRHQCILLPALYAAGIFSLPAFAGSRHANSDPWLRPAALCRLNGNQRAASTIIMLCVITVVAVVFVHKESTVPPHSQNPAKNLLL